jgi:hypothetical protein
MKEKYLYPLYILAIILALFAAGCVAPPTETPVTPVDLYNPNQFATDNSSSTTPGFIAEVTIENFAPSTKKPLGYTTFLPATPIPEDITCLIYSRSAAYAYNGTAFTFDQKNPPMYINYTVIPTNVTVNRVFTEKSADKTERTVTWTYSDYSPSSWFEVTVRDNATKEIYLQDGFGRTKGYTTYLSRTLKVLKGGDLLVELRGNDIKASTSIWVKPIGNFDESKISEFTTCTYMDERRDTLAIATPTTVEGGIYTWTPENQERR